MPPRRSSSKVRAASLKHGWRSGLEEAVGAQLDSEGVSYRYEVLTIPFLQPAKARKYTPDYLLPNGIILETKGRFVTSDRQKMILVQNQYPDLDIRFVFSNSRGRISKQSKTTYAVWCKSHGFPYADKQVPLEWLREPKNQVSVRAIKKLMEASS